MPSKKIRGPYLNCVFDKRIFWTSRHHFAPSDTNMSREWESPIALTLNLITNNIINYFSFFMFMCTKIGIREIP